MPLTSQELQTKLWQAADILRGQIDSADYKNYIFSILFLKRLSDRFDEEVASAVSTRGVPRETALTDPDEHEFFVPEDARWPVITSKSMGLGEALNVASFAIEDANTGRLDGVLTGVNWNDEQKLGSPANREGLIRQLLNHFAGLDLSDANLRDGQVDAGNVLGDAYEYLIYQFADDAGKKGGEFYTPREVVRLIVELLEPQERMRICDPTAGSCGMLIYAAQYVQEQGGDIRNLVLHGQERNLGTLAIGKLNLLLHGLRSARLEAGDVIAEPGLVDSQGRLLSYDRVIANPPFSLKNWGHEFAPGDPNHRFDRYGAIPPKTRGDLAFLLHMLAVTNAQGRVGVVMPHGVLFRGGAEGKIRRGHRQGRPVRGGHRPGPQPVLRGQHPRRHLRAEPRQARRPARQGAVRGRGPAGVLPRRAGPELPRPGAHRRHSRGLPRLRGRGALRPRGRPGRDRGQRLQPEHQPLRGHHRAGGDAVGGRGAGAAAGGRAPPRRGHGTHGRAAGGAGLSALKCDHRLDHGCNADRSEQPHKVGM